MGIYKPPPINAWVTPTPAPNTQDSKSSLYGYLLVPNPLGSKFITYGGTYGTSGGGTSVPGGGYMFDSITKTWTTLGSTSMQLMGLGGSPPGQTDINGIWNGKYYYISGGSAGTTYYKNTARISSDGLASSIRASSAYFRAGGCGLWTGTYMLVWGGTGSTTSNTTVSALNVGAFYAPDFP
jgi:hypothetical protein